VGDSSQPVLPTEFQFLLFLGKQKQKRNQRKPHKACMCLSLKKEMREVMTSQWRPDLRAHRSKMFDV
jgi:hypothetical protein